MLSDHMRADELPNINMTPMVDLVLCLLVFFMAATQLAEWDQNEFEVNVPEVASAAPLTQAPDDLTVTVVSPGRVAIDDQVLTLDELGERLAEAGRNYADQAVIIRGDAQLAYQHMADVLSTCNAAGIKNVRLPVRPRPADGAP